VLLPEVVRGGVAPGDDVELHQSSATLGAGTRLVEADVAGLADAQQLEVDAALRSESTPAIRRAIVRESASWLSTTTVGIFSNRVPGAAMAGMYSPAA
jgi:hypothetical protein